MDKEQYRAAKARLVAQMQEGQPWQVAAVTAGVQTSQSTAYRLLQVVRKQGEAALQDGRHGHPVKLRGAARTFLEEQCRHVLCRIMRLLRNLADPSCGMLRVCAAFHHLRFLQTTHLLFLMVLLLVLSVLILFTPMEHAKLEQIEFGATIHASFNELQPIHIPF